LSWSAAGLAWSARPHSTSTAEACTVRDCSSRPERPPPVPAIEGLARTGYLDNRTLFSLTEQPEHLLVMGGGAIGVELAQAFAQLGSRVTLVEGMSRILIKEEPDASAVMTTVLERAGVDVRTGSAVKEVSAGPTLHLADGSRVGGSHLLVAVGRKPATSGVGAVGRAALRPTHDRRAWCQSAGAAGRSSSVWTVWFQ